MFWIQNSEKNFFNNDNEETCTKLSSYLEFLISQFLSVREDNVSSFPVIAKCVL